VLSAIKSQVRIILLDIEGTTTPVDFVYQTLFPYASSNLESYLREHFREYEIVSLIQHLQTQHRIDEHQGLQPPTWDDVYDDDKSWLHSAVAYSHWLMANDSKCTALKSLQGKIWQEGYANGELHGLVYADVPPAFERWRQQKRQICIYSSGSILSQRLLYRSVPSGDLTHHIAAFFDTRIGSKTETQSYRKIAKSLACNPCNILFISDTMKEIRAAHNAGMQAILCYRDLKASPPSEASVIIIHSFNEVFLN